MNRRRRQGLAEMIIDLGYFNTAELVELGRAYEDVFDWLEIKKIDVVDVEDFLPSDLTEAQENEVREEWNDESHKPAIFLQEHIDGVDLGAALVRELAERGFKIVRER